MESIFKILLLSVVTGVIWGSVWLIDTYIIDVLYEYVGVPKLLSTIVVFVTGGVILIYFGEKRNKK